MNKNLLFGKAVEHYIISLMCRKGLDCYVPVNALVVIHGDVAVQPFSTSYR